MRPPPIGRQESPNGQFLRRPPALAGNSRVKLLPAVSVPTLRNGAASVEVLTTGTGSRRDARSIGSQVREAVGAQERARPRPVAAAVSSEMEAKAASKAAFDAALEHAVGVLEKQQKRMLQREDGPSLDAQPLDAPQVGERRGMFATQQRAEIKKDSALLEAQREHAALAREQAEQETAEVASASVQATLLAQKALKAIAASRLCLLGATERAEKGSAVTELNSGDRDVADEALRRLLAERPEPTREAHALEVATSCGELSRRLMERSHARCLEPEAVAVGAS